MGYSMGGIAFTRNERNGDPDMLIGALYGSAYKRATAVSAENRNSKEVMAEIFDNFCCIYDDKFPEEHIFRKKKNISSIFKVLGEPELLMVFCHYDSGDSFGYSIYENGLFSRRRLYTNCELTEEGDPKDFELEWINASTYIENEEDPPEEHQVVYYKGNREEIVSAHFLTAKLLREALENFFGMNAWEDMDVSRNMVRYRRLPSPQPQPQPQPKTLSESSTQSSTSAPKRPWWKFW